MKKQVLSLLLVIVMLLTMLSITTMAASTPTITSHKNGKSYAPDDFYIKWNSVSGAKRYRLAVKSLNDGSYAADIWWDDNLTKTKYECDEDDIKPGHRYKIWVAACGSGHDDVLSQYSIEVIAEDECEHDDYDEEVDDIEYEQISGDDTYHYATEYYDRVCNDCGETIKKNIEGDTEKEKHSFSGDKCKKCGYTKKTQSKPSISSASVSPTSGIVNDTKFYFTIKTNKNTTDLLVVSQDGWDITSNYLKDLKSSTSGDTKTWTFWLQMNNINSSYVNIYALNDDGDESSAKKVSFSLSDGVCQHKDYDEYLDDTEYDQISGDDTYHYVTEYYERVCDDCGETIKKNIEGDTEKEKHNFSGDKCKNCGYTKKAQPTKPSISSASVSPTNGVVNDTKFYFTVKTNKDTTDLLVVSQDGWDITSNYLKDLKSTTSGETKTWTFWLQMNNVNSSYVNIYALNDDGDESNAKKVSFSLTTGVCPHKNYDEYLDDTDYEKISGDDTYHYVTEYYERVCDDCGETIKKNIEGNSTKEKHNFSGNKCKKCGYTIKTESKPSINSASVSPTNGVVNDTKFKFTVKTNVDTTDILVKSFDGWDITSDYLQDLKCSTSGSTKTWTFWLQMNNVNSSYVNVYALNDNDDMSSAKKVSFSLSKGVCKHANYDEYLEDTDYEPISGDETYHYAIEYNKRVCEDCNTTIKNNIKGSSKKEKHSFSGDKCKDCGYTKKSLSKPTINSASVSPTSGTLNDTKFKFTVKTNKDATDLLVRAFNGYEITSNYLNDLKCSTSGSTKTWTFWLKINNIDSKYINIYALNDNGDESSAKKVSFTVKEAVVKDTTKPQVTNLECENGETFTQTSGYVTFNAKASDNISVSKIELYLGNTKLGTENGSSVGFAILGSKFKVGKNTISAYAYDDAGNKSSAKTITLNIKEQQTISKPSINSASVSPTKGTLNETQFKFTVKTNKDTTDLLVRAFNGYEITSDYLNDLKCSTSGSTKTWTFWLKINNINSSYVNVYALNDNDDESGAKKVSFTVSEPPKKDETSPVIGDISSSAGSTFKKGTSTKITVAVTDENLSEAVLYVDNEKIKNFTSGKISSTLSSLTIGTHNVTIKAMDKAGNAAEKSITLTVTDPKAVIPTVDVLSATNITATSATLQGKVTSNSGVKIKKYGFAYDDGTNIQYKWIDGHVDNNKVFTANITGLKPETAYSYQVIAVNENDIEGKSNNYVKFTTLEGVAELEQGKEEQTFTDVSKDEYYSDDVEELNSKGIITGYSNGEFKPNNTLTRAEAAVILCRLNGNFNVSPSKTKFSDVNSNYEWASGYIAKAVQLGIISGMPDGTYNPEGTLTAEQFITMIVRWMGLDNNAANRSGENWADGYIAVAREIGLLDDVNMKNYSKNISRADASVIANTARGLKGNVAKEELIKDTKIEIEYEKSSKYKLFPIVSYTIYNENVPVYETASDTSKIIGNIKGNNECLIEELYSNDWVKVSCGNLKGYVPAYEFILYTDTEPYEAYVTMNDVKVNRRISDSTKYGSVSKENVLVVSENGNAIQIIYKIEKTSKYKLGWVDLTAFSNNMPINITNNYGAPSTIPYTKKLDTGMYGDIYQVCSALHFTLSWNNAKCTAATISTGDVNKPDWKINIDMSKNKNGDTISWMSTNNMCQGLSYLDNGRILIKVEDLVPIIKSYYSYEKKSDTEFIVKKETQETNNTYNDFVITDEYVNNFKVHNQYISAWEYNNLNNKRNSNNFDKVYYGYKSTKTTDSNLTDLKNGGCGVFALINALDFIVPNYNFTDKDIVDVKNFSLQNGCRANGEGTKKFLCEKLANSDYGAKYGFYSGGTLSNANFIDGMNQCLSAGGAIYMSVRSVSSNGTVAGHIMCIVASRGSGANREYLVLESCKSSSRFGISSQGGKDKIWCQIKKDSTIGKYCFYKTGTNNKYGNGFYINMDLSPYCIYPMK